MGEVSMRNHHINNVASYCCGLLAFTAKQMSKIVNKQCVNKFGTENNFILDYLSESSRHEANILSKWVWIFSPYPPYTATWYNTPVSCSQIAMSPQNVLSVHSVSSVSVVILIWRLCQNIISMASNNLQNKFIQNYGIEILKRKEKYR